MVQQRSADPTRAGLGPALFLTAVALGAAVWGALFVAFAVDGQRPPGNPFELATAIAQGDLTWSTSVLVVLAVGTLVVAAAVAVVAMALWRRRGRRVAVDAAAPHMATRRDVAAMTYKPRAKQTRRLTSLPPDALTGAQPAVGLPLGTHVPSGAPLWSSWEDMALLVAGPRTMKSSAYTIPLALAAPGPCFITENKRGVLDHTRAARAELGQVWVFDPQNVAATVADGAAPTWWWNPLTYVTDESKAEKLAAQIAESTREPGARTDGYFDGEATNLLGLMLLAAATAHEAITVVYTWLTRPDDPTPARVLDEACYRLQAESLESLAGLAVKQRDGIYGTARSYVNFLRNRQMTAWITPPSHPQVREFSPYGYVRSTDTLYALSNDGRTSAGPLVGALTLAVFEAAEAYATSVGGRLPVPMVGLLDEAANICRFKDLDSKYSYYGSFGIVMVTVLQSWDQGEEIWGKHGMEKLWSAANVRIYGGAVSDHRFLQRLSDLVGPYEHRTGSVSYNTHDAFKRNRTHSVTERPVLTVADLGALPPGRAVVFASRTRPALVKVRPWFDQKVLRPRVEASLAQHAPRAETAPLAGQVTHQLDGGHQAPSEAGGDVRSVWHR